MDHLEPAEKPEALKDSMEQFSSEVLAAYGFKELPFSQSPNPRFLYLTSQHQAALMKIMYSIQNRQGLTVVTGDVGSGKTSLARHLFGQYIDHADFEIKNITNPSSPTEVALLRIICNEFGVEMKRSYVLQLQALQEHLTTRYLAGVNCVVIIDEAQLLKPSQLELLRVFLNFETDQAKLCQIILFGQLDLALKIKGKRALKSRVFSMSMLPPCDPDDMRSMIEFRCRVAGGAPGLFTDSALKAIYDHTDGVPRDVINLCAKALLLAYNQGALKIDQPIVEAVVEDHEQR